MSICSKDKNPLFWVNQSFFQCSSIFWEIWGCFFKHSNFFFILEAVFVYNVSNQAHTSHSFQEIKLMILVCYRGENKYQNFSCLLFHFCFLLKSKALSICCSVTDGLTSFGARMYQIFWVLLQGVFSSSYRPALCDLYRNM